MTTPITTLFQQYVSAFREESKLRGFVIANLVDDVGVAVSTWATTLLMTNLFTSQRERASLVLPSLVCFLLGTIGSGPLADWAGRRSLQRLARWRWRLVIWARLAETAMVGVMIVELQAGPPSIARVLPFVMLTAFTKTAFRPTRIAFSVDLLTKESPQLDPAGQPLVDERGSPLEYKTHLLALTSLVGTLGAAATLVGLLVGARVLALAAGAYAPMFAAQALMHLGFVAIIFFFCHPTRAAGGASLRDLVVDVEDQATAGPPSEGPPSLGSPRLTFGGAVVHFGRSLWEGARFLAQRQQRPLLILMTGTAIVEFVSESYDGKMIVKHILHGSDEALRHADIAWSIVGIVGVALVPALARAVGSIGRIFLLTMLIDGVVMAVAGRIAAAEAATAILPFTIILGADHTLTLASDALTNLAQNSASSAAMRGRIAGTYAFVVIIGDMVVEAVATPVSESLGIPGMLFRVGVLQVAVVSLLAIWGGRALWRFGLREAV